MNNDLRMYIVVLIIAGVNFSNARYLSVYWYKNFRNRKYIIINNKLIFNFLAGKYRGRSKNPNEDLHNRVTYLGTVAHIVNVFCVPYIIFTSDFILLGIYTVVGLIFTFTWGMFEKLVYTLQTRFKYTLPKEITVNPNKATEEYQEKKQRYRILHYWKRANVIKVDSPDTWIKFLKVTAQKSKCILIDNQNEKIYYKGGYDNPAITIITDLTGNYIDVTSLSKADIQEMEKKMQVIHH